MPLSEGFMGFGLREILPALLSCLVAIPALADEVRGTRSQALRETAHRIRIVFAPGEAELRVRRSVHNGGARHDQAEFDIVVPEKAVATGLATLGEQAGRPFWFRGELMEAEAAAAKYRELTGIGGYYPKDPALLSWRQQTNLMLQVFPCPPGATKWVEYTLKMPTHYEAGRYFIEIPRLGSEQRAALASVVPSNAGDRLFVNGEERPPGYEFALNGGEIATRIELLRALPPRFAPELASFEFASERVLTHYRVAAAPALSAVPRRARVAVVLDGSRSFDAEDRLGALAAARAYLSHFRDAEVEVVAFDRKPRPRYGRLVPVARALRDLQEYQILPENGSHVDLALAYADALLAQAPKAAPRRILLITDARTRARLTPIALAASVARSRALVHVALPGAGEETYVSRLDDHAWASFTRPTGGLVWNAGLPPAADPVERARVLEEWVRPTALDHVAFSRREGAPELDLHLEDGRLREGEAVEALQIAPALARGIELTGELWTEPVRVPLEPDESAARRWAALAFGSDLLHDLSEPEMMVLARHGGAVSPVTSYLAVEPGVRPSTEGLDWGGGGAGVGIGLGNVGVLGHGAGAPRVTEERQRYLEERVAQKLAECGAPARSLVVDLETTRAEIVELPRFELAGAPDSALAHCVSEGVWGFVLPAMFRDEYAYWTVRL